MTTFQDKICDAILNGDVQGFKKLHIVKADINRQLVPYKRLEIRPKYNPQETYITIYGPTAMMYAILCEQDEILQYILDTLEPDASIYVQGYNALHLAAITKDWHCLRILLQYKYFQENIDMPVKVDEATGDGSVTTALHCAISNRRLYNVMLLVFPFPKWKVIEARKSLVAKPGEAKQEGEKTEEAAEDADDQAEYDTADVIKLSATSKSPPVYMAVSTKQPKIVRVLLAAGADVSQMNKKGDGEGENTVQLITRMKEENDKRPKPEPAPVKKGKKAQAPPPDPIDEMFDLIQAFQANPESNGDLDTLRLELCPELCPKVNVVSDDGEEEDAHVEEEEEAGSEVTVEAKKIQAQLEEPSEAAPEQAGTNALLSQMIALMQTMDKRLKRLESAQKPERRPQAEVKAPSVGIKVGSANQCCVCTATPAVECKDCHRFYCDRCQTKPDHKCH